MKPSRPKRTRQRAAVKAKSRPTLSPKQRKTLESDIGYRFQDETLLTRCLTHPSLIDDYNGGAKFSNQRMEFLGDRVLGLVMAELMLNKYPTKREGHLTKLFHTLVSGETCAKVGERLNLREYLFMDASMQSNQSGAYDKAVADAVEAMIAAIYMDSGLKDAEAFIRHCWIFDQATPTKIDAPNPKTVLSDWCGAERAPYATYETIAHEGPAHEPNFTVKVSVEGHGEAVANGNNKQDAEKAAAAALLKHLKA